MSPCNKTVYQQRDLAKDQQSFNIPCVNIAPKTYQVDCEILPNISLDSASCALRSLKVAMVIAHAMIAVIMTPPPMVNQTFHLNGSITTRHFDSSSCGRVKRNPVDSYKYGVVNSITLFLLSVVNRGAMVKAISLKRKT